MKYNNKIRPICAKDIAERHPYNTRTQSDGDYAAVGNKIIKRFQQYEFMDIGSEDVREIALRLTLYFEDVVSDLGIWRSFTSWCYEHYGRYIPFYQVDDVEYYQDEPHVQDCRLIIWYAFSDIIPNGAHYPFNKLLLTLSTEAFAVMEEEFEKVAINEELKAFLQGAVFTEDFHKQREMLRWVFSGCYLTHTFENDQILEHWVEMFSKYPQNQGLYQAACKAVYDYKIGPLALPAKDYLAMILDANGCEKQSHKIADQEYRDTDLYKVIAVGSSTVTFKSIQGDKLEVPLDCFSEGMPWDKVKYIVASFVKYGSYWNLNGMAGNSNEETFLREQKNYNETYDGTPNYAHLMKLSGGSPLFYFSDKEAYIDFMKKEMKFPSELIPQVTKSLEKIPASGDVTIFVEGEKSLLGWLSVSESALKTVAIRGTTNHLPSRTLCQKPSTCPTPW